MKKRNNDYWIGIVNSFLESVSDIAQSAVNILENNEKDDNLDIDINKFADRIAKEKVPFWSLVIKYIVCLVSFLCAVSLLALSFFFPLIVNVFFKSLSLGFFALSAGILISAERSRRLRDSIKTYLPAIGFRPEASVSHLAHLLNRNAGRVKRDIKQLLNKGVFQEEAYYDKKNNILVLDGYVSPEADNKSSYENVCDDTVLDEWIKKLSSIRFDIVSTEISIKLDIIINYVRKISDYVKQHKECEKNLRTLINYYLPTTIKLMNSYKTIEKMGDIGNNISETKSRIENTMDSLVAAYKKQFEMIYSAEAFDVSGDIDVLEAMMKRHGVNDDK